MMCGIGQHELGIVGSDGQHKHQRRAVLLSLVGAFLEVVLHRGREEPFIVSVNCTPGLSRRSRRTGGAPSL